MVTAPTPQAIGPDDPPRLGWATVLGVTLLYVACMLVASYPLIWTFRTTIAGSLFDPLQHLWIMRWYKTCLLEGRSPILCPELQYPVGAALGNFSPLHFQALLYIPLSFLIAEDAFCFNLIWMFGMVTTGLGTFLLAWQALRDRWCAAFAGMLAMMAAPMFLHGRAHLELIHLGSFPLFLVTWVRFIDRPGGKRLAAAAATYILVALCAAYYVVFAAVPACLYVAWGLFGAGPRGAWAWARDRALWLAAFGTIALASLALVFGSQLWSISHGYSGSRSLPEFNNFSAAPWTFFTPTVLHPLAALMPVDIYGAAGFGQSVGERASYLGVVTLGLLFYSATRKAGLRRSGFLWATLALLVILAWGGVWRIGTVRIELPAVWLKKYVPAFKMIRVPARFNLFVGVVAAVLAAAGLKHLLDRLTLRIYKVGVFAALFVAAMADLSTWPFHGEAIPPLPPVYAEILRRDPAATLVEIPQSSSGGSMLYSVAGYWQSQHRARTNAGYSGSANIKQDDRLTWNSPFLATLMARPDFLADPSWTSVDVVGGVNYLDYAWAYLHANEFRYVVLHNRPAWTEVAPENVDRLKALLAPAKIYEDDLAAVYDREKLAPPRAPVVLSGEGWRPSWYERQIRVAGSRAKLIVYNPDPKRPVTIGLNASTYPLHETRKVKLTRDGVELGRLEIGPDRDFRSQKIGPLDLPAGFTVLTLEGDAETLPTNHHQAALENDWKAYSYKVAGVVVSHSPEAEPPTPKVAGSPRVIR